VRLSAADVADAVGGELVGPDVTVDGGSIDTRTLVAGQLFVPVVAERDGHDFIGAALDAGARAYLTARVPEGATAVRVADTSKALWALGTHARTRVADLVVGITGSVGKTTVKDLVAGGLAAQFRTHATHASFNNELGVPLTLLATPEGTEVLVLELGARHPGDIARLRDLTRPNIGVITSIGTAHAEHLGGSEGVAIEKGSLIDGLPRNGYAVLNDVDCGPDVKRRTAATVVTFGRDSGDVRGIVVDRDEELRPTVRIESPWGSGEITLAVRGDHQAGNAAAAVAVAVCAGVDLDLALAGVASAEGSALRAEFWRAPSGLRVLNDCYNANPASMAAALRTLALVDAPRRVAVLGEMAELGAGSVEAHQRMSVLAGSLGIEVVAVGGAPYMGTPVESLDDALDLLEGLSPECVVLLKASRTVGLDRLATRLRSGVGTR
jgi:UDP-N-acetylmuramoyl-tripeptide--D-alanyl-D-alanine ligase